MQGRGASGKSVLFAHVFCKPKTVPKTNNINFKFRNVEERPVLAPILTLTITNNDCSMFYRYSLHRNLLLCPLGGW